MNTQGTANRYYIECTQYGFLVCFNGKSVDGIGYSFRTADALVAEHNADLDFICSLSV